MEHVHHPVLATQTIGALMDAEFGLSPKQLRQGLPHDNRSQSVFVDGTFGRGGHSRLLLEQLPDTARLVVFDKDPEAIEAALSLAAQDGRVVVVHDGFSALVDQLTQLGIKHIDGIMLDLGVSSPQVDDGRRGFSFMRDGPLDMRMDPGRGPSAAEWLAMVSLNELKEVIGRYGEERFAFKIAKAIVTGRESRPLRTTHDLAELVARVVRTREKGQHPATRTFQAIRIHINQELQELAYALKAVLRVLAPGGRLAVISFHSLEDRMVKQFIAAASRPQEALARLPVPEKDMPQPILESRGRVRPETAEVERNPRSRSAVLRVAQRTTTPLPSDGGASFVRAAGLVESPALATWYGRA